MADPYNCVRFSGTLPGGEVWSINPKFQGDFGTPVADYDELVEWAEAIQGLNAGAVFPASWLQLLSDAGRLTTIRCEYYDATGKLAAVAEIVLGGGISGSFSPNKPFQSSVVLSLRSGRPGRSYRGRLYLPALNVSLSTSTLRISSVDTQAIADEGAGFLRAVADAAPTATPVNPAIVSQTLGLNSRVTSVQVGNIVDIQRRRRDALAEAYSTAVVGP